MNILIFSWRSPGHPNAGGAEKVTFEHARAWVKAGHNVFWFSSFYKKAKRWETKDGVVIIRRGHYVLGVRIQAFLWYFFGKHERFDLVIDEFHGIPFFTPLFVRAKILAFIHEVAKEVWRFNPWPKPLNIIPAFLGKFLEPFIFKIFYKKIPFMTVSNSTKSDLIKWGIPCENIRVIHNGVKVLSPKRKIVKNGKKTALYLGALSEDKGTLDAIRVFSEIDKKDKNWQYWIVGKGTRDFVKKVEKLAKELGVYSKTKIFGFVNEGRKFELISLSCVLINPSFHEGWGLVNIEANSLGIPVVGYNVSGMKDSVINGKTGILVEPGNYKSLADEALKLVLDKKKYKLFSKNCKKWAKNFTWQKSTKESLKYIESLI